MTKDEIKRRQLVLEMDLEYNDREVMKLEEESDRLRSQIAELEEEYQKAKD